MFLCWEPISRLRQAALSFKSSHEVVVSLDPKIVLVEALEKDTNVALNCQKKGLNLISGGIKSVKIFY